MNINMERIGDNVYCDDGNHTQVINMKGVDDDIFWETASEEALNMFKDDQYQLHIEGFRS